MQLPCPVPPPVPFWDHPGFAALLTGAVAILVLIVNSIVNTLMQGQKLKADRELARERFDFDKAADERRIALERSMDQWRRRVEFAEQQLTSFYEARSRLQAIRSPGAFGGEAVGRPGRDQETEALRQQRDTYYPVERRLQEDAEFFRIFYSKRFLASALLGPEAEAPYADIWSAVIKVQVAVAMLMRPDAYAPYPAAMAHRERMEGRIWEGAVEPDTVAAAIHQAVTDAEAIFRPVIIPPAGA
jgi:hypothetical protein